MHNPAVATQQINKCPRCGAAYISSTQRDHAGNVTVTKTCPACGYTKQVTFKRNGWSKE